LQIQEMEAVVRQSQSYAQTLQNYNTSLQADVQVGSGLQRPQQGARDTLGLGERLQQLPTCGTS